MQVAQDSARRRGLGYGHLDRGLEGRRDGQLWLPPDRGSGLSTRPSTPMYRTWHKIWKTWDSNGLPTFLPFSTRAPRPGTRPRPWASSSRTPTGELVTFTGPTFDVMTMVDISSPEGQAFVLDHMNTALDKGFDGWMADYAEWLPVEAQVHSGSGWTEHNTWPVLWQELNAQVMEGRDGSYFVRSGWAGSASVSPVVWAGDQRTSFDPDDGFPTILPLGLGTVSQRPAGLHPRPSPAIRASATPPATLSSGHAGPRWAPSLP